MDLAALYHLAGIIGGTVTVSGMIVLVTRGKRQSEITAEWRELATVKGEKIAGLEKRLSDLEEQLRAVRGENNELRRLNLQYQREVMELRQKVGDLEREISHPR